MGYKFGVGLYSVRDELTKDMWVTLRKVKSMGYDGVEFFGNFTHTAQEIKAALDDTGLDCCGWHTPWTYLSDENFFGTVSYFKTIGNTEVVVPGLPEEMTCSKDAWLNTAKAFNEVALKLKPYGMKFAYHNHWTEFKEMDGDIPFHYLFDNVSDDVGMQLDNGNAFAMDPDTDIYDPYIRYPFKARTLHHKPFSHKAAANIEEKDYEIARLWTGKDDTELAGILAGFATMFGEDDIDWSRIFKLCAENQNIDWHTIEYECEKAYTQFEGIEKSINVFKKMEREGII